MTTQNIHTLIAQSNSKSAGACIALYLFFGLVGVHRFYVNGVTLFNLLYALTIGFFGIGFLIDFFLVWGMAARANTKALQHAFVKDQGLNK